MHTCFPAPLAFWMAQEEKVSRKTHTYNSPLCQQKAGPQENSAKGKRKTIRLPLPDREWWASQQRQKEVLCLASDVYKRPVFSHKSEEPQKWQEREEAGGEKQREGDMEAGISSHGVDLAGCFQKQWHTIRWKQRRNKSLETEDRTALLPWATASHLSLVPVALWDLGQGTPPWAGCNEGRQLPPLSGPRVHQCAWPVRPPAPMNWHWTWGPRDIISAIPVPSSSVPTAQPITDFHTVPSCRGSTKERETGGSAVFDMDKWCVLNPRSPICPDCCPYISPV